MFDPGPCVYMEKLAVAGDVADAVDFEAPIEDNLAPIAKARGKRADDVTVAILDRPRHEELVAARARDRGADQVHARRRRGGRDHGRRRRSSVDVLVGIGGTPEGVIAACALKCLDG